MPRRVDHEQRRRQIADALLRVAAARGLHAAGMREVAAEAGVSVRLVQYYFETRQQLVQYTVRYLAEQMGERIRARVRAAGPEPAPRAIIEAILTESLPADAESRMFHLVYSSNAVLTMTDPALTIDAGAQASDAIQKVITGQLRAAQEAGQCPPDLDPPAEAAGLMAMSAGCSTSVLLGHWTAGEALGILRRHLDRLLPPQAG